MQLALRNPSIYWDKHHPEFESLKNLVSLLQLDVVNELRGKQ